MPKDELRVDPHIKIKVVPDGEIHIIYALPIEHLEQYARAWLAMTEGKMKEGEALMALRLRSVEAVDYLIQELIKAKKQISTKE